MATIKGNAQIDASTGKLASAQTPASSAIITDISNTVTFDGTDSWDTGTFTTKEVYSYEVGNKVTIKFNIAGTGKGTGCIMYIPFTIAAGGGALNLIKATETVVETVGQVQAIASSNQFTFRNAVPSSAWTDAVTRKVEGQITFHI